MINKKILCLTAALFMTIGFAGASNLVQMDIKKSSDSAVDMTFYTTGNSGTPMVTRKADNKYVILMPNVSGSNAGTPSLGAVRDLITNVDVKNVDDGINGYTKVTVTTTKPINIKAHTQRTNPLSAEENEAKALIAQIKTRPGQAVAPAETAKTTAKSSTASTSTVSKAKTEVKKADNKAKDVKKAETPKTVTKAPEKPADKVTPQAPVQIQETPAPVAEQTNSETISDTAKTPAVAATEATLNLKEIDKIEKMAKSKSGKNHFGLLIFLLPLWVMYLMAKGLKNSVQKSNALKSSFNENLAKKPYVQDNYEDIINDKELNWQERYKKFVSESNNEARQTKYNFITPKVTKTDIKRIQLENTLKKTPEIYKNTEIKIEEEPVKEVKAEEDTIPQEMIKLKAFAKPVSLSTSHRNRVKKALPKLPNAVEGKFVKLRESEMNSTRRNFRNGALSVTDLMNKGKRFLENPEMETSKQEDFVMSSVDEYFSILDKENELMTAPKDLSTKIAGSLSNIKPSMKLQHRASSSSSNPIAQKRQSTTEGLIVKTGYNIDENRGFYIVNLDGVNSLVGRINNETFVLKNFDTNVDKLQVRLDSENVYMVKAGDFKALVDVDENKMGVLIEL